MKKFISLTKLLFVQQYRVKPTEGKKRRGGTIAAYIILAVCFAPMLVMIAIAMFGLGKLSQGLEEGGAGVCAMLIFMSQGAVLLFGIPTLISNVFTVKDADKLLFLPIRSSTVFTAKLTVAYLNEVITTAVMLVFMLLPFGIGYSAPVGYYLLLLLGLFLIPLLPMLIGSIIAIPLSALITKVGKNGVVKTILQTVMFFLIMAVYLFVMYELGFMDGSVEEDSTDIAQILLDKLQSVSVMVKYVHSNYTFANAMLATTFTVFIVNLLIAIAENVLLLGLVIAMALPFYHWMLTKSVEGGGSRRRKTAKSNLQVKNQGVVKELIFTDLKRITRESQIGFQSILSLIMLPVMVVIFYLAFGMSVGEEGKLIDVLKQFELYQIIAPLIFVTYMSMLGITSNIFGLYPISRENKSIYLVKSLPVSFNKYLLSKVILATAVMLISDFLTCLLIVILFGVKWYYGLAMLCVMAMLSFGGMCITTLVDLKSPKLGWTNFNQSLKNAKNSWIGLLIGLVTSLIVGIVGGLFVILWYFTKSGWYVLLIMWLAIIGVCVAFAFVCYKIMTKNAQKYFEAIEP